MRKRLRIGNSGPRVARADGSLPQLGDILTALADGTPVWASGLPPGSGLLSNVFWIDQGATSPGDGSIIKPWQSFTQAMAGVPVILQVACFLITPYDYSAEPAINLNQKYFAFKALGGGANGLAPGGVPFVAMPTVVCDDADNNGCSLYFQGCSVQVTAARSLIESDLSSLVVLAGSPGALTPTTRVFARGDGRQVISCTADFLEARGMRIGAATLNTGAVATCQLINCTIGGNQTAGALTINSCTFSSTVTLAGTVSGISLKNSNVMASTITALAGTVQVIGCDFDAAAAISCLTLEWDDASLIALSNANGTLPNVTNITDLDLPDNIYGNGFQGTLNVVGANSLGSASDFQNITISGAGVLTCNLNILRVRSVLDIANAQAGGLCSRDSVAGTSGTGGNAAGAVGGTAGAGGNTGRPWALPSGPPGTAGAAGVANTNGAQSVAGFAITFGAGGNGGGSQAGGTSGTGKAGGAIAASNGLTENQVIPDWNRPVYAGVFDNATPFSMMFGQSGRGGSSGGGDAANAGGGGGGGGAAGRGLIVYAKYVRLAAGTPDQAVSSRGGNGGNGAAGVAGDAGGGSGGGAGGGGYIQVVYDFLLGALPVGTGTLDARAGNGGNGGNGSGTGGGGGGGDGGQGGRIVVVNRAKRTRNIVTGGAATAGSVAVGGVGGGGGVGGACKATFI